jgi:glycosyltransferase involved in cell wall biosynthesis
MLIQEGASPDRIHVIPLSVDTTRFRPTPKDPELCAQWEINADDFVVLFMGRFAPEKGIVDLLKAIPQILEKDSTRKIRFCFVGDGPLLPLIRQAKNRNLDAIRVHSFVPYENTPRFHNMADILVLPSIPGRKIQEQFGYVLIESMACAKPVITTCIGSISEVVGDAAVLVDPNRPDELAQAIYRLWKSPQERTALSSKGLNRVVSQFSVSKNAALMEQLYESVIHRRLTSTHA